MDWQLGFTEKHGKVESRLGFAYYDAYLYGVVGDEFTKEDLGQRSERCVYRLKANLATNHVYKDIAFFIMFLSCFLSHFRSRFLSRLLSCFRSRFLSRFLSHFRSRLKLLSY